MTLRADAAKPPVVQQQPLSSVSMISVQREQRARKIDAYADRRRAEHEKAIERARANGGHYILDSSDA